MLKNKLFNTDKLSEPYSENVCAFNKIIGSFDNIEFGNVDFIMFFFIYCIAFFKTIVIEKKRKTVFLVTPFLSFYW